MKAEFHRHIKGLNEPHPQYGPNIIKPRVQSTKQHCSHWVELHPPALSPRRQKTQAFLEDRPVHGWPQTVHGWPPTVRKLSFAQVSPNFVGAWLLYCQRVLRADDHKAFPLLKWHFSQDEWYRVSTLEIQVGFPQYSWNLFPPPSLQPVWHSSQTPSSLLLPFSDVIGSTGGRGTGFLVCGGNLRISDFSANLGTSQICRKICFG